MVHRCPAGPADRTPFASAPGDGRVSPMLRRRYPGASRPQQANTSHEPLLLFQGRATSSRSETSLIQVPPAPPSEHSPYLLPEIGLPVGQPCADALVRPDLDPREWESESPPPQSLGGHRAARRSDESAVPLRAYT